MLKYNFIIDREEHLTLAQASNISEIILPIEGLSKEGGFDIDEAIQLVKKALHLNLNCVILADRLVEESIFSDVVSQFSQFPTCSLRVSDIGLASWLFKKQISFQLSLETGNLNECGIEVWVKTFQPFVKRIVLNHQIAKKRSITYFISCRNRNRNLRIRQNPYLLFSAQAFRNTGF